jgi:Fe2+ transport system protein FeoA
VDRLGKLMNKIAFPDSEPILNVLKEQTLDCPMCGYAYSPAAHASCEGCPVQKGCSMVCCPACGYQTINPASSSVYRLAETGRSGWQRLRKRFQRHRMPGISSKSHRRQKSGETNDLLLTAVAPGHEAQIAGFTSEIPAERKARLQAYGLVAGQVVRVLQHNPVTVITIEHLELAMETDLAQAVLVKAEAK